MSGVQRASSGTPWESVVGYSRAVAAGPFVFVSGCTSTVGGEVAHVGDAGAQTAQAIRKLRRDPSAKVTGRVGQAFGPRKY